MEPPRDCEGSDDDDDGRDDLNRDTDGFGGAPARVASRGTSCVVKSAYGASPDNCKRSQTYGLIPFIFAFWVVMVAHGGSRIGTDGGTLLIIREGDFALMLGVIIPLHIPLH